MKNSKSHMTQPIKWASAMTLLKAMDSPREQNTRLMLACGFFFGLRISDILKLTWSQIMSEDYFIIEETKTKKSRRIDIDPYFKKLRNEVLSISKILPNPDDLVFVHQRVDGDKSKPISIIAANKRIKSTFEKYGIDAENPSSHMLRKSFGRRIYEVYNRCDDALILLSQIFNHTDTSVTRRYIGITSRRISNAYLSLSSGKALFEG